MVDQIYLVVHIGKNLLIVMSQASQGCLFRLVNSKGEILQEQAGFDSPESAETAGRTWLEIYLNS